MAGRKKNRNPDRETEVARGLATTLRRAEALSYRLQGWSYLQIGEAMGIAKQSAHELVQAALAELYVEPVEDLKKIEAARLDQLQTGHFDNAVAGDVQATATVLQIQARRARLFGLDAPAKQELGGEVTLNHKDAAADEAKSKLAALIAAASGNGVAG